jgi:hypothetical protein
MKSSVLSKIVYIKNQDIMKSSIEFIKNSKATSHILIPHVCNNVNVFGGGFTASIDKYFPIVKANYNMLGNKSKLGYTQFVVAKTNPINKSEIIFANMIAQNKTINKHNNPRPLNYAALVNCMIKVKDFICDLTKDNDTKVQIFAPKFGSGLAGGDWKFIEKLIEDIWSDIPVYIYQYSTTTAFKSVNK